MKIHTWYISLILGTMLHNLATLWSWLHGFSIAGLPCYLTIHIILLLSPGNMARIEIQKRWSYKKDCYIARY